MKKCSFVSRLTATFILFFYLFCLHPHAFAADVFYIGSAPGGSGHNQTQDFTLWQRVTDLVDFASFGDNSPQRSGSLSGRFSTEFTFQNVSGNRSKSFYAHEESDYKSELNLNLYEKIYKDYTLEGEVFLRKTDNPRIESSKDLRMKQLSLRYGNASNEIEFGDLYADFSTFTLSDSLEGFHVKLSPTESQIFHAIAARSTRADVAASQYQRNAFGGKTDLFFFSASPLFTLFRVGVQALTVQDDSSTAPQTSSSADLDNTVVSIDGEMRFKRWFSLDYEVAHSQYVADDEDPARDRQHGTALRLMPGVRYEDKASFKYLYYYVQPEFFTSLGSASRDKEQHQFSLDLKLNEQANLSFVQNLYWDHLEASTQNKRTVYDEKYVTLNFRPLKQRSSFSTRTYFNYLNKKSDDPGNSIEANTGTVGFSLNDTILDASVNLFYEYRAYDDKATPGSSDYFNRFGGGMSRDWMIFDRRFYLSCSYSTDIRNTKQDPDKDANTGLSLTGSYDLLDPLVMRFGHNIRESNNATPDSDYTNNKSYLEWDYLVNKKRAAHVVVRGEYNRYDHEDGDQDYNEMVLVSRFVSNF